MRGTGRPTTLLMRELKSLALADRFPLHTVPALLVLTAVGLWLHRSPRPEPFVRTVALAGLLAVVLWLVATVIYEVGKNVKQGISRRAPW